MIKVLAIGNSFSQDATSQLQHHNKDIFVRNVYFGGCSLEQHVNYYKNGESRYEYQENGVKCLPDNKDLVFALTQEKWDVITVQQVSGKSGKFETYEPYLGELIQIIRKYNKDAEIMWHQTWAYERNSTHCDFPSYGSDTDKMWNAIKDATDKVVEKYGFKVIPAGAFIEALRAKPCFDIRVGGVSLHRDGFHLNDEYGRYASGLVWDYVLTGKMPDDLDEKAEKSIEYKTIKETAKEFFGLK
ncbi:MAG: DUF4886 domain-containing protein [Bacilli bacterium]|nr:DUF4886 domain-containing protein [Bacilli bacterium]